MSNNQTLKFELQGEHYKMFFRYPDRVQRKLSQEEKEKLEELETKRRYLISLLGDDKIKLSFRDGEPVKRKGTGPITTEFHVIKETGKDEAGKSIFSEFLNSSSVRYDSSSKRNSYEQGRQYAINKWFSQNNIIEESEVYGVIKTAYEGRSQSAPSLRNIDSIEELSKEDEKKPKKGKVIEFQPASNVLEA